MTDAMSPDNDDESTSAATEAHPTDESHVRKCIDCSVANEFALNGAAPIELVPVDASVSPSAAKSVMHFNVWRPPNITEQSPNDLGMLALCLLGATFGLIFVLGGAVNFNLPSFLVGAALMAISCGKAKKLFRKFKQQG